MDTNRDFDVAISFVHEDVGLATELRDGLGDGLDVFIYTKKQEEVAGTDGLESFRDVFRTRSRLVVILLRERWGKTPWTRVELEAITDRFLDEGGEFLFVISMDDSAPPPWIPKKLIRFSLKDFGSAGAIGAIKARALDRGSTFHRPTAVFLAQRAHDRAKFAENRARLIRSEEGVRAAAEEAKNLLEMIADSAGQALAAAPDIGMEFGADSAHCVLKTPGVAVRCSYRNRIINVLEEARLVITELRGGVLLPGQPGYYQSEPVVLDEMTLTPDIVQDVGWCWRSAAEEYLSSEEVSRLYIERFFALLDRQSAGKLPRIVWD